MPERKTNSSRPLRADAARNRVAILEAAEALLGSDGGALSTNAVARRASVGVGTVFRHFPTKEQLIMAVVEARLGRLTARARAIGDDHDAFYAFFEQVVDHTASTPAIRHALAALGVDVDSALEEAQAAFMEALAALVERAQRHGQMRADVSVHDVFELLVALVHVAEVRRRGPGAARRAVAVVLDGLRQQPRSGEQGVGA